MDARRSYRLLLRVYAAENLRHVSSQGTFCKVTIEEGEAPSSTSRTSRGSLKRLLHGSARAQNLEDSFLGRMVKTQVQKSPHGKPVWNEKFDIPNIDPTCDILQFRIKSARVLSAPAIGGASVALRDLTIGETMEKWINLFDNSRKPAGRLRIQVRVTSAFMASQSMNAATFGRARSEDEEERDTYYRHPRRTTSSSSAPSPTMRSLPRSNRRGAIIAPPLGGVGVFRRSSTLSRSLLESRTSGSTTASDSISSDDRNSPYTPSETSEGPEEPSPVAHLEIPPMPMRETSASSRITGMSGHDRFTSISRTTGLSMMSRETEELDFLASKYMAKPTRDTTVRRTSVPVPEVPRLASEKVPELPFRDSYRNTVKASEQPVRDSYRHTVKATEQPFRDSYRDTVKAPEQPFRDSYRDTVKGVQDSHEDTVLAQEYERRMSNQVFIEDEDDPTEAIDTFNEEPVSISSSSTPTVSPSTSPPTGPTLSEIKKATGSPTSANKSPKDGRSPRTTNTTAMSSDDDGLGDTIEFDFDTGDVRRSTRLPSHMMRSTTSRPSIPASLIESDVEDDSSDGNESDYEDDELDPDGDPDGPRMILRATVTQLLGRDSVNVIMDVDEQDEDDDDYELDAFVFDEFPILDMRDSHVQINDVDCMDHVPSRHE